MSNDIKASRSLGITGAFGLTIQHPADNHFVSSFGRVPLLTVITTSTSTLFPLRLCCFTLILPVAPSLSLPRVALPHHLTRSFLAWPGRCLLYFYNFFLWLVFLQSAPHTPSLAELDHKYRSLCLQTATTLIHRRLLSRTTVSSTPLSQQTNGRYIACIVHTHSAISATI